MNDVRDILDVDNYGGKRFAGQKGFISKPKKKDQPFKRPEGMHRELFALLSADGGKNMHLAPLLPTDAVGGYKEKAKLGAKHCRPWKWTPFINPARKDGAVFYHWKRSTDEPREYPFAKFNKEIPISQYSESEYTNSLDRNGWTKPQTDHLFDLCRRFDLRFPIIQDRWNKDAFGPKSIEDLKERYYQVSGIITKLRSDPTLPEPKVFSFDAESERKRKQQLDRLWKRSPDQVEEEEYLRAEMKKIEARKKEREKKTQDLQKLITAADAGQASGQLCPEGSAKKSSTSEAKKSSTAKKKSGKAPLSRKDSISATQEIFSAIKWPDFKTAGVSVRSQKMKLPNSVGQKKTKAIEQILNQLGIEPVQIPTEETVLQFNELRSDIVLLYELKSALSTCDLEISSLASQYEVLSGGQQIITSLDSTNTSISLLDTPTADNTPQQQSSIGGLFESPTTPFGNGGRVHPPLKLSGIIELPTARKRKAALEQRIVLKQLKGRKHTSMVEQLHQ